MNHFSFWGFGDDFTELAKWWADADDNPMYKDYDLAASLQGQRDQWRNIQSLFRLMQQRISAHEEVQPPRATRRRAKREGLEEKNVTVIRLRRPKKPRESSEARDVDWGCQWLVGLHWRNQWFPSLGVHRQLLIHPYLKGPEDKPLRIRDKRAFELTR